MIVTVGNRSTYIYYQTDSDPRIIGIDQSWIVIFLLFSIVILWDLNDLELLRRAKGDLK
jgi:hypothetical protein